MAGFKPVSTWTRHVWSRRGERATAISAATFAVLLLLCSSVALATSESIEEVDLPPESLKASEDWLPDSSQIQEGIRDLEREEGAQELALERPEAALEREESLDAFAEVSAAGAQQLLQAVFADQIAELNLDPARSLSDAEAVRAVGEMAATVTEDGESALLDAGVPIKVEDETGELEKVDLSLERAEEGLKTANALSDVRLGDSAAEPVEVGEDGMSITQIGAAADSDVQTFGAQNAFYFEALTDTDTLVSPISSGVEIFNLLRSEQSPETFRFKIGMPEGAELLADDRGGAFVTRSGEVLSSIPFPTAVDAQGTDVPVELTIEGDTISLHIAHRSGDYAMPILLDPILEDWVNSNSSWQNGKNLEALSNGAWKWDSSPYGLIYFGTGDPCYYTCWGRGLYLSAPSRTYGPNTYSAWVYQAPNIHSYVSKAWLIPFWRDDHNCDQYAQPHDYDGFWDHLAKSGEGDWNLLQTNEAEEVGSVAVESWGRSFIVGLSSGGGVSIPCARDVYVGGAAIWLDDWNPPSIDSVSGLPPAEWLSGASPIDLSINASDAGLGVYRATVTRDGKDPVSKSAGCTGLYGNRCPNSTGVQLGLTGGSFGEGIRSAGVAVEDPTGKAANGPSFQTKVDYSAPEVTLSGQLAVATDEDFAAVTPKEEEEKDPQKWDGLPLPVYKLKIAAEDGSLGSNLSKRSGVKDIEVFLDGNEVTVPWSSQGCPASSCGMTQTYELQLTALTTAGKHTLEVQAVDQVGNERERKIEFEYLPATGIEDEYVMHYFPLPDGSGNEAEEEHPKRPELAVNVMNGNLVYREQDVDVDGNAAVDLEVERYYNSMLPTPEDTEWGDGWTLAETPELDPVKSEGSSVADQATVLSASGKIRRNVQLPTETGAQRFDAVLRASLEKKASGGYELTDETGESATSVAFDETGQAEALLTEGHAKVDYSYDNGDLEEIAVEDPGSTNLLPDEVTAEEADYTPSYTMSFGSLGTGNGQFDTPGGLDMAPDGTLWVADSVNDRVLHFEADGDYLGKIGSYGEGNGQFDKPVDVEVSSGGNVYVADANNDRIQKFSSAGAYVSKFGTFGSGNGQFKRPEGIAVDQQGRIWVADAGNNRIQKFSAEGGFMKAIASAGSGEGQLYEPMGIDVGPSGNVFVADWDNNRVVVFSEEGAFVRQFGIEGEGDGEFRGPVAIEVDAAGLVWVSDEKNERIEQFDQDGNYIMQLGEEGTGDGEMELANPMGIVTDNVGNLFFTDSGNDRVQRWNLSSEELPPPTYVQTFGSYGTGNGQFNHPGGLDLAPDGTIWVADSQNHRIVHLKADGSYLGKFGSYGSANGQFKRPVDLDVDASGNVYVVDTDNDRIQKFSSAGTYLSKFGTNGTGNGQFKRPEGIAIGGAQGDIWVADTLNNRIQKFNSAGTFVKAVGSAGWKQGQLDEPMGIDIGPGGGVLVADWDNDRVVVFNGEGSYVRQFGIEGYGGGQFRSPVALDVDSNGYVWVSDEKNERIEQFDQGGNFLSQFGTEGSGTGQMELANPMGIVTDTSGNMFLTDSSNDRIQRWQMPEYEPPAEPEPVEDDPAVEIETPGGLVSSVEGEEAGEHSYDHYGDDLVAYEGPEGETKYEYDGAGQMTKVTLPNGSVATIAYFADKRVKSVTVDPVGSAPVKTTGFEYTDAPTRRTVVTPQDAPHVTYDIGDDGSVLKWWNTLQPPVFDFVAGSLYESREKDDALLSGDRILDIQAHSEEGIASVHVILNGDHLVHETVCDKPQVIECKSLISEWVTHTDVHAPGHLYIEVLVTDRLGYSTSERFWVDIPEPPPPPAPGTPVPPKFADILQFRQDYGLEVVFPVANEIERNERIFNLINAWYLGDPVVRASMERWGVPLRLADIAELEYREWLNDVNGEQLDQWVEEAAPGTFAGYHMDHKAGGIMRIGFTQNQASELEDLENEIPLVGEERLEVYLVTPTTSSLSLEEISTTISSAIETNPTLRNLVTSLTIGEADNRVHVGALDVSQVQGILSGLPGGLSSIVVEYLPNGERFTGRFRNSGRLRAGDSILNASTKRCTAGFGAYDKVKVAGKDVVATFVLTAGHCYGLPEIAFRSPHSDGSNSEGWKRIGFVRRRAFGRPEPISTDAEAIRLNGEGLVPRGIFGWGGKLISTGPARKARVGNTVCFSGAHTQVPSCGEVVARERNFSASDVRTGGYLVDFDIPADVGDSGAPVWNPRTGASIGLVTGGNYREQTLVEPLLHPPRMNENLLPGILNNKWLQPLHLKQGD